MDAQLHPERVEPVDRLDALTVDHLHVDRCRLQVGVPQQRLSGARLPEATRRGTWRTGVCYDLMRTWER